MTQLSLPRWLRFTIASLALVALLIATVAPVLASRGHVEAVGLYMALEPLCHQRADRSWSYGDLSAGLCIRCYGVYAGIAAAALLGMPFSRRLAFAGMLAAGGVWGVEHLGGLPLPEMARFAGGGVLGLVLASVTTTSAAKPGETARGDVASND